MFVNQLKISIENLKGIKSLVFDAPTKSGVYVLCGVNGCGKTTLLTVLARISDSGVFSKYLTPTPFDDYSHSKITYHIVKDENNYDITFQKAKTKWHPNHKNFKLSGITPFNSVIYISTANQRFLESSVRENPIQKTEAASRMASPSVRQAMKRILNNQLFENLRYQTIKNKGAAVKSPRRGNKVFYVPLENGVSFSEINFSFGERMVLNTLDTIENIKEHSLLLIDEIELALHPTAQLRLYEYLSEIAKERNIMIILSTHSPSLIRKASNRIYLDHNKVTRGVIEVKTNCYPAYILRDVTFSEDVNPDFLLFVEDIQAKRLLSEILRIMIKKDEFNKKIVYRICPVSGWEDTIELMEEFKGIQPYSKKSVQAFPDKDAEAEIEKYLAKEDEKRTDSDRRRIALWNRCHDNITPLHITPELGVWNWIKDVAIHTKFKDKLEERYGFQIFDLTRIIHEISIAQPTGKNDREKAKYYLMDVCSRIKTHIPEMDESIFYSLLYETYIESNYDDIRNYYKPKICQIINRR